MKVTLHIPGHSCLSLLLFLVVVLASLPSCVDAAAKNEDKETCTITPDGEKVCAPAARDGGMKTGTGEHEEPEDDDSNDDDDDFWDHLDGDEDEDPAELGEPDEAGSDIGVPQMIDRKRREQVLDKISVARRYLKEQVMIEEQYAKVRKMCRNKAEECAFWAVIGECESNPGKQRLVSIIGSLCPSIPKPHGILTCFPLGL